LNVLVDSTAWSLALRREAPPEGPVVVELASQLAVKSSRERTVV